jgi:hypothetical protein
MSFFKKLKNAILRKGSCCASASLQELEDILIEADLG